MNTTKTAQSAKKRMKPVKAAVIVLAALIAALVLAFAVIRVIYPGILRASHRIGGPGIDFMETVEIGGIQQVLYFRGQNVDNPVILFLHGGPGSPARMILHHFQYEWENDFTVVHWDQRQAGKTYVLNDPEAIIKTLSYERMLKDAHEVTQYIKQKMNKEQIIVLGSSWGSMLGSGLVQRYPQDYCAYIGVGQMVSIRENEQMGYEKVLEAAHAAGNQKDIAALEAFAPYPPLRDYDEGFNRLLADMRQYQTKYKLADGMSIKALLQLFTTPYYTLAELMGCVSEKAMLHDQHPIYRDLYRGNGIRDFGDVYQIPVYYIMGENDFQTPYPLAKEFFGQISASDKMFYSIPNAGHVPMIDNKTEFNRVLLKDILPRIRD
jgi:pimeloyl-ACP methyl ester carboxylesterase